MYIIGVKTWNVQVKDWLSRLYPLYIHNSSMSCFTNISDYALYLQPLRAVNPPYVPQDDPLSLLLVPLRLGDQYRYTYQLIHNFFSTSAARRSVSLWYIPIDPRFVSCFLHSVLQIQFFRYCNAKFSSCYCLAIR